MSMKVDVATGSLKTIRLYGEMGRLFGRVHKVFLSGNTTKEALQFLLASFPEMSAYLTQAKERGVGFSVFSGKRNLVRPELEMSTGSEDIRIAPMLFGSKKAGVFQIIVGVILVIVGVLGSVFGEQFGGGVWGPIMWKMGISMILGGVIQLLTPVPKGKSAADSAANSPSYSFNGPVNTTAQGHPVPCIYGGPMKVGSAVISGGISVGDTAIVDQNPGGANGTGGHGGDLYGNRTDVVVV